MREIRCSSQAELDAAVRDYLVDLRSGRSVVVLADGEYLVSSDIAVHPDPQYPTKVKARRVAAPIWECDEDGEPLTGDAS